ncbi:hypothetical protein PROFUN_05232 [Planoprotostelium fungivorum]|uniref:Zinc-finger domain-containing protein n=1 Tax=Planoprotostelium fungivorum TaxID=1890364 RepID=A0A2P6NRK5_9EUKA|nr:hypothetical protein PROFUN_05232 [Planoprotostelium fungivorum]
MPRLTTRPTTPLMEEEEECSEQRKFIIRPRTIVNGPKRVCCHMCRSSQKNRPQPQKQCSQCPNVICKGCIDSKLSDLTWSRRLVEDKTWLCPQCTGDCTCTRCVRKTNQHKYKQKQRRTMDYSLIPSERLSSDEIDPDYTPSRRRCTTIHGEDEELDQDQHRPHMDDVLLQTAKDVQSVMGQPTTLEEVLFAIQRHIEEKEAAAQLLRLRGEEEKEEKVVEKMEAEECD